MWLVLFFFPFFILRINLFYCDLSSFQLSVKKPKPKQLQCPIITNKRKQHNEPIRTRQEDSEKRGKADDLVAVGFPSDWLTKRFQFSKLIKVKDA